MNEAHSYVGGLKLEARAHVRRGVDKVGKFGAIVKISDKVGRLAAYSGEQT